MARFGTVLTAMVTPFAADGSFDPEATAALARWLVEHGTEGLVVAGTTGESPVLTDEERIELFRVTREAVEVPIVAGATTNDTAHSVAMVRAAADAGADAILAVVPYYNKPSQAGLIGHFTAIAEASDLAVMLYDVPGRTGSRLETDTIIRLAHEIPNVVALKDAGGNPTRALRLLEATPDGFEIYSGDEPLNLGFAAYGAVGVVGVSSHWSAPRHRALFDAVAAGDLATARRIDSDLQASYRFMNTNERVFSQSVKTALGVLGMRVGDCRLPLGPAPAGSEDEARRVLLDLGYEL